MIIVAFQTLMPRNRRILPYSVDISDMGRLHHRQFYSSGPLDNNTCILFTIHTIQVNYPTMEYSVKDYIYISVLYIKTF